MVVRGRLFVEVLVFASLWFITVKCGCPDGWHTQPFLGQCYVVIDRSSTWIEALSVCNSFGGQLVEITSRDENDHVKDLARQHGSNGLWIGGHDFIKHGEWRWATSGKRLSDNYTDWAGGQPDGQVSRCLQLWTSHNYMWDDVECHDQHHFICERSENGELPELVG